MYLLSIQKMQPLRRGRGFCRPNQHSGTRRGGVSHRVLRIPLGAAATPFGR